MSEIFKILDVATSGMGAYKTWLNAVADNVANMNNVVRTDEAAFQERFIIVEPKVGEDSLGDGVVVAGVEFGDPNGIIAYEPNHPLADEEGMVRRSAVSLPARLGTVPSPAHARRGRHHVHRDAHGRPRRGATARRLPPLTLPGNHSCRSISSSRKTTPTGG